MKKLITLILSAALVLCLSACSSEKETASKSSTDKSSSENSSVSSETLSSDESSSSEDSSKVSSADSSKEESSKKSSSKKSSKKSSSKKSSKKSSSKKSSNKSSSKKSSSNKSSSKNSSSSSSSSIPAIGVEIGSESYNNNSSVLSSETTSSEETFDPSTIVDNTGKDPFINDETTTAKTVTNGFEIENFIIVSGFKKISDDQNLVHGGNVSLCSIAGNLESPGFYFSVPDMQVGAECELTIYVMTETEINGNLEISSYQNGIVDVSAPLDMLVPGKWSPVTASFFAGGADIYLQVPAGYTIYCDDITLTYKQ